jgi:hypothetical protein
MRAPPQEGQKAVSAAASQSRQKAGILKEAAAFLKKSGAKNF